MGKKLVDPNKLCMGCMGLLQSQEVPCPKCGFFLKTYEQPKNSMPPYEIINGKYLTGRVIGVGGFGITYIGWDFYQSKRVCIKEYFPRGVASRDSQTSVSSQYSMEVMTNSLQAQNVYTAGLQAYIKEAETLSRFYLMPGVVSVRDFFYGNRTAYIVMEYIEGIDLRQLAKVNGGKLTPGALFTMLQDVMKALHEVHKAGIVHRDISPDNIMVNRQYQAKLIDFGAAKHYQGEKDGSVFLKHGYAPIEQYSRNGYQGPWTDVYSISATIYYLLSGVKLQKAPEREKEDRVAPLRSLGVSISEMQERAIHKGLAIKQEDRYQRVSELYRDLYQQYLPESKKRGVGEVAAGSMISGMAPARDLKREEAAMAYLQQKMRGENS